MPPRPNITSRSAAAKDAKGKSAAGGGGGTAPWKYVAGAAVIIGAGSYAMNGISSTGGLFASSHPKTAAANAVFTQAKSTIPVIGKVDILPAHLQNLGSGFPTLPVDPPALDTNFYGVIPSVTITQNAKPMHPLVSLPYASVMDQNTTEFTTLGSLLRWDSGSTFIEVLLGGENKAGRGAYHVLMFAARLAWERRRGKLYTSMSESEYAKKFSLKSLQDLEGFTASSMIGTLSEEIAATTFSAWFDLLPSPGAHEEVTPSFFLKKEENADKNRGATRFAFPNALHWPAAWVEQCTDPSTPNIIELFHTVIHLGKAVFGRLCTNTSLPLVLRQSGCADFSQEPKPFTEEELDWAVGVYWRYSLQNQAVIPSWSLNRVSNKKPGMMPKYNAATTFLELVLPPIPGPTVPQPRRPMPVYPAGEEVVVNFQQGGDKYVFSTGLLLDEPFGLDALVEIDEQDTVAQNYCRHHFGQLQFDIRGIPREPLVNCVATKLAQGAEKKKLLQDPKGKKSKRLMEFVYSNMLYSVDQQLHALEGILSKGECQLSGSSSLIGLGGESMKPTFHAIWWTNTANRDIMVQAKTYLLKKGAQVLSAGPSEPRRQQEEQQAQGGASTILEPQA